ncbi:hypothetical protein MATR_14270 [Marivirga tractuosa]|uniref:Uncharacterized protein n=1 Tax=Marivirga tractuosa (strain ATCC 23168 / DSM 4126 / NBRC 15989 / NCIMB 1408 / VKM B-1430 / H-43) TaxID=643867 RepID=E4TTN0_MARTH|nr:hypothetical protein [Marivirga tractuosa]ADR20947.1 hypothetical protein Ftrac_0945 [Marivirga tractuosa DSM 4126]BDD14602.1 hypothetical protein MATR_14270 [Marivirga tractuosa]
MKPNFPKHSCVYKSIKIEKPYKLASLNLIFFLAFLFSCQEQEVEAVYPEEAAINGYIGLQDSEKLNEAFMQAKEFVNRPNRRTNFPFQFSWDMVDHSRVLQIVQNGNGNYSNYTFSIEQKDESNFLNLVLKEQADGFYGALFEYHYLTDANGTLVNTIERINKYSLDGRLISQYNTDSNNGNTNRLLTETCYKASVEWLAFDGSPCDPFEFEEEDDGCWETVVLTPVSCIQSDPHGGGNDDGTNEDVDDWGTPLPDPEIGGGTSPGGSSSGEPSSPEDDGGSPSAPGEAQDELIGLEPPLNGPSPLPQCGDGEVRVDGVCINEELYLMELWKAQIDHINNPEEKRKEQLMYIATHNAQAGRDFKDNIESLIATPGITRGEVDDINKIVNDYWEELVGRLIMANFYPVVETAKWFVQLALIETGSGVLFHSVKGLLSVKWGVQLANIGINTKSIAIVVNRMKSGLSFGLNNSSLTLKIGGRNLLGLKNSNGVYKFTDVTNIEAKAIFEEMVAGRKFKTVLNVDGKLIQELRWQENGVDQFVKFRNFSKTNEGEMTIEVLMKDYAHLRGGRAIKLKFYL